MDQPTSLRWELLVAFGLAFVGGVLLASLSLPILQSFPDSPGEAVLYILALLLADLAVIYLFGWITLGRSLLRPIDGLVEDVRTLASGSLSHRIRPIPARELQTVADSVNALAERLILGRESLAENVRSLDETNRALVEARAQVVRSARLASTGTLASGIAHELGNPLGALMAYVDVARSRAESGGSDTELLDSVRAEADRIDRIIRSLLDFARSREGTTALHHPWSVVQRVRELLEAQGKLGTVEVLWEGEQYEDIQLLIDPQQLEQVLVNLLLNALDAVGEEDGGWIRVTLGMEEGPASFLPRRRKEDPPEVNYAHRRRIVPSEEGFRVAALATAFRVVFLRVEDNGPGLPPESLDEIFDPFFTTKEPGKGTGLGLALSAQLIEGMGGAVEAENRVEGGAKFTVRLPEVIQEIEGEEPEAVLRDTESANSARGGELQ
jgi:two-component system NtrC family sensor kinase